MNSTHIISQDVFDKIRSRFSNLEMGDPDGGVTTDPKEATFFDFDFMVEGQNLGRVSISINETGALKLFYSQSILEDSDEFVQHLWYDFLREMRMFAKRRLLRFDTRDITKSNLNKDDFQYLATNGTKDNEMTESIKFEGGKKTSYRVLEKTKIIAKHRNSIEDESAGARSRKGNIKALYIENSEGERFKYPFIHIAGAKAMQRHVANGGVPYDDMGNSIIRMSEQITQLTSFKRHVGKPDGMNQKVNEITSKTDRKLDTLRRTVEGLASQGRYEKWKEAFVPNAANSSELDQTTLETYKSTFTVNSFREDLAQYFPLIHDIMQEAGEIDLDEYVHEGHDTCPDCHEDPCVCDSVKEADDKDTDPPFDGPYTKSGEKKDEFGNTVKHVAKHLAKKGMKAAEKSAGESFEHFEEWANRVEEGRLEPDALYGLKELLDGGLTLDKDGESAIDALQGIGIHSEDLEEKLRVAADPEQGGDPNADPREIILAWLADPDGGNDPEAAADFGNGSTGEPTELPAPDEADPTGQDQIPDEDMVDNNTDGKTTSANPREIAEFVYTMYNKEHKEQGLGPFPKGKSGVVTAVTKKFGPHTQELAERFVDALDEGIPDGAGKIAGGVVGAEVGGLAGAVGGPIGAIGGGIAGGIAGAAAGDKIEKTVNQTQSEEIESILTLAGIKEGPKEEEVPAYLRKAKRPGQEASQKAADARNTKVGAKVFKSPRTNEDTSIILKLAGLAK
jgi:hypothetical protein